MSVVIDRMREQIQDRLDQALSEADRLRKALVALDPRSAATRARTAVDRVAGSRRRARPATSRPNGAPAQEAGARPFAARPPASGAKEPAAPQTETAAKPDATGVGAKPPDAPSPAAPVSSSGSAAAGLSAPVTRDTAATSEQPAAASPRRTPTGQTRAAVLAALAGGESMTASQVADRAGLSRGAVSSTLSRLAKTGEVQKAERGYRLMPATPSAQPTDTPTAAAGGAAQSTAAADAASPAAQPTTPADA